MTDDVPTEKPGESLPNPNPKRGGKPTKEVTFARPVFAEEVMTNEGRKRFNELPPWQRHLIKRVIDHGDLTRAAKEAGVSTYVNKNIDAKLAEQKSIIECLNDAGLTAEKLAYELVKCLEAKHMVQDNHKNLIELENLTEKRKTIELLLKVRGEFDQKPDVKDLRRGVVELFNDTNLDEPGPRTTSKAKTDNEEGEE